MEAEQSERTSQVLTPLDPDMQIEGLDLNAIVKQKTKKKRELEAKVFENNYTHVLANEVGKPAAGEKKNEDGETLESIESIDLN